MTKPTDVVMFSGGVGSWAAARRVAERKGTAGLVLLFADTLIEDPDLYRFIEEAAANVGAPLVRIAEGRTPWQVMEDEKIIGNSRFDPCSKILKRKFLDKWRNEHCDVERTTIHVGIDWSEQHRLGPIQIRTAPWRYEAPMCAPPYLSKMQMIAELKQQGIAPPRLYALGFPHNNCGGQCIKAGQAQWELLLRTDRPAYLVREEWEEGMRVMLKARGRDEHSILKDRAGGVSKPLTLRDFRIRVEQQPNMFDKQEWGGCACGV
jgi:hypothetical protein